MKYKQVIPKDNFYLLTSLINKNDMYVKSGDSLENFWFENLLNKLYGALLRKTENMVYNL